MLPCRAHRFLFLPPYISGAARHIGHVKAPQQPRHSRGGQNLTDRYQRLERSLGGKEELSKDIDELAVSAASNTVIAGSPATPIETFRGFPLPKEPRPPQDDECCMSNCAICVYDLYEESLEAYRASVAALRSSLLSLNIPQSEWPSRIRESDSKGGGSRKDVILSAFEEMERSLKTKHQNENDSTETSMHGLPLNPSLVHNIRRSRSWGYQLAEFYRGLQWVLFSNR